MDQRFLNSNSSVVSASTLEYVFSILDWLQPYIEEIHHHSTPRIFMFRRNQQGKAVMFYKHWWHNDWSPSSKEELVLLKVVCQLHVTKNECHSYAENFKWAWVNNSAMINSCSCTGHINIQVKRTYLPTYIQNLSTCMTSSCFPDTCMLCSQYKVQNVLSYMPPAIAVITCYACIPVM